MSTLLPPRTEDRIELDDILRDSLRAPPPPPTVTPWDEPLPTSLANTIRAPRQQQRWSRFASGALAVGLGVAAAALTSALATEDDLRDELVATADSPGTRAVASAPRFAPEPLPRESAPEDEISPVAPAAQAEPVPTPPEVPSTVSAVHAEPRVELASSAATAVAPPEEPVREDVATEAPLVAAASPSRGEPPNRAEVRSGLERVRAEVAACAGTRHGRANVRVTIHPSGRVQGARVEGTFAGSAQGSCIARAVREARFPSYGGEAFEVSYPFEL